VYMSTHSGSTFTTALPPLQGSPQAILKELHERESLLSFTKH
jgi:hypothetical protein